MPTVRNSQAACVHGRVQRAHATSSRPSSSAAHRERERHREADVAGVEHRRMNREREILQQRVQVATVRRRRHQALERIRGRQDEQLEADADEPEHAEHAAAATALGRLRLNAAHRERPAREAQRPRAAASLRARPTPRRSGRTSAARNSSSAATYSTEKSLLDRRPRRDSRTRARRTRTGPRPPSAPAAIQRAFRRAAPPRPKSACGNRQAAARGSARNGRARGIIG